MEIDVESLKKIETQLTDIRTIIGREFNSIKNNISSISSSWEGDAAKAYISKANKLSSNFSDYISAMEKVISNVTNTVSEKEKVSQEIINFAKNMFN